jgi:hypothetical protein
MMWLCNDAFNCFLSKKKVKKSNTGDVSNDRLRQGGCSFVQCPCSQSLRTGDRSHYSGGTTPRAQSLQRWNDTQSAVTTAVERHPERSHYSGGTTPRAGHYSGGTTPRAQLLQRWNDTQNAVTTAVERHPERSHYSGGTTPRTAPGALPPPPILPSFLPKNEELDAWSQHSPPPSAA